MSIYQKALKVFSIIVMVMGGIVVATGAVVIVTALMVGTNADSTAQVGQMFAEQGMEDVDGGAVTYEVASMGVSVAFLGAIFLATGIFGLLAARDPNVTLPVLILSLVGLTLSMLNLMGGLVSGTYTLPGSGPTSLMTSIGNVAIMAFILGLSMYCRAAAKEGLIGPVEREPREGRARLARRIRTD